MAAARICLGQVGAAHGVSGEVRLRSFTADPAAIAGYGPLETEDGRIFQIETLRPAKDHFIARLSGVRDRDAARALANTKLYVPRERLPEPDAADEFYHADLVGLAVVDPAGNELGTVVAIHNFGAGDLDRSATGRGRDDADAAVRRGDRAGGRYRGRTDRRRNAASGVLRQARGMRDESKMWRASVLTIFPDMFPGTLGREPRRQGARGRARGRSTSSISAPSPPTSTAPSTTRRPAAGRAW